MILILKRHIILRYNEYPLDFYCCFIYFDCNQSETVADNLHVKLRIKIEIRWQMTLYNQVLIYELIVDTYIRYSQRQQPIIIGVRSIPTLSLVCWLLKLKLSVIAINKMNVMKCDLTERRCIKDDLMYIYCVVELKSNNPLHICFIN